MIWRTMSSTSMFSRGGRAADAVGAVRHGGADLVQLLEAVGHIPQVEQVHGAHVLRGGGAAHGTAAQGQGGLEGGGAADAAQGAGGVHHHAGGGHPAGEVVHHLIVVGVHGEGVARAFVVEDLTDLLAHLLVVLGGVEGQDGTQLPLE